MSKRHLITAIMLIGILTGISCKKDSDNNNIICANLTGWLKNGHEAVFVNTPIFISADTLYTSFQEVSVGIFKSTSKFDDGTVYPIQTGYLQTCNNSIFQATTASLLNKQEVYRVDGNIGDSWTSTTTSVGGSTITTISTITDKNVLITVPAGTFNCIEINQVSTSSSGGSVTTDTYINNAAGPVLIDGTSAHYELARKNY